jgi:hypothetical protein
MSDALAPSFSAAPSAPSAPTTPAAPAPPAAPDVGQLADAVAERLANEKKPESEKYADALKAGGIEAARQVMLNSADPDIRRVARIGVEQRVERESIAAIPVEARPGADPSVRLRELEYMKAHDNVRYVVEGKAEHEALLAKQAEAGPQPVRALSVEDSVASIRATEGGQQLITEWADTTPAKVQAVQQSTLEMLRDIGDQPAQASFMYGISQLPGEVQTGFARELSSPAPANVTPARAEAVAEYADYGITDPMGVARAEARVDRMLKSVPVEHHAAGLEWFRQQPLAWRRAVVKQLARG